MADVWTQFEAKLVEAGYTVTDVLNCSEQLFLSVVQELGGFTALQTAKLQTEIRRRKEAETANSLAVAQLQQRSSQPASRSSSPQLFIAPSEVLQSVVRGSDEFERVQDAVTPFLAANSEFWTTNSNRTFVEIHSVSKVNIPSSTAAFLSHQRSLCDPSTASILKWKIIAEADLAKLTSNHCFFTTALGADALCPSGIVLYGAKARGVPPPPPSPQGNRESYVIVGVETVLGKTKLMEQDLVAMLQGFPMERCFSSLQEDGFDSIQVRDQKSQDLDAVVILHTHQALVKYVIRVQQSKPNAAESSAPVLADSGLTSSRAISRSSTSVSQQPPVQQQLQQQRQYFCPSHPSKLLEFYCPEERELLCSHCLFHNGYNRKNCLLLEDAAPIELHDLKLWAHNADNFLQDMNSVFAIFNDAKRDLETTVASEIQNVRSSFDQARRALDTAEELLVESLNSQRRDQVARLQDSETAVRNTVQQVEELALRVRDAIPKHNAAPIENPVEVLLLLQRAWQRWEPVVISPYEIPRVRMNDFPTPASISTAVHTAGHNEPGGVGLPEAIDVNYLQTTS